MLRRRPSRTLKSCCVSLRIAGGCDPGGFPDWVKALLRADGTFLRPPPQGSCPESCDQFCDLCVPTDKYYGGAASGCEGWKSARCRGCREGVAGTRSWDRRHDDGSFFSTFWRIRERPHPGGHGKAVIDATGAGDARTCGSGRGLTQGPPLRDAARRYVWLRGLEGEALRVWTQAAFLVGRCRCYGWRHTQNRTLLECVWTLVVCRYLVAMLSAENRTGAAKLTFTTASPLFHADV